jgi:hypothetical protein
MVLRSKEGGRLKPATEWVKRTLRYEFLGNALEAAEDKAHTLGRI